jgi:hypothetical protein
MLTNDDYDDHAAHFLRTSSSLGEAILDGQHRRVSILWAGLLYNYCLDLTCFMCRVGIISPSHRSTLFFPASTANRRQVERE